MYMGRFIILTIYLLGVCLFKVFVDYFYVYFNILFCKDCEEENGNIYDYIIVGCGSSGAISAYRLSEDQSVSVLVLEAGSKISTLFNIPAIGLMLQGTTFDWQHITVPQSAACFALNKKASRWPMGKIVGGTSMLNNMIYVRGHRRDFDEWFTPKAGYAYEDVLYYFNKSKSGFSTEKPLITNSPAFSSLLPTIVLDAAKILGYPVLRDIFNCEKGFAIPKVTQNDGQRWTPAHFLIHKDNSNIVIKANRIVERILFRDNFEAYGVEYNFNGGKHYAIARRAIILSAGVIGSAKILMLSGIGHREHLKSLNINLVKDLPVGDNLQDHVTTALDLVFLNSTLGIGIEQMISPFSLFKYFWHKKGPWTTGGCEVLAFLDSKSIEFKSYVNYSDDSQPDLQLMVMPLGINEDEGVYLRHLIGISDDTWVRYFDIFKGNKSMSILPVLLHPKSRGTLRLRTKNPSDIPLIDPKYLSDPDDVRILIRGIQVIKQLIHTEPMKQLGAKLNNYIFPGCENFDFDTQSYWECYVRHLTITSYHPIGTCKMGPEEDNSTVVNYDFQVKGTNKLFVVDGSVMPSLTSGNINAAILMLAEMAADSIKYNYYMSIARCSVKDVFISSAACIV